MSRRSCLLVVVALMVAGCLWTASASADLVSIANSSVETPLLTNDTAKPGGDADFTAVTSWSVSASSPDHNSIWNPPGSDAPDSLGFGFVGASGDGTPSGGAGANIMNAYLANGDAYVYFYQDLAATLPAKGRYTLSVAVGERADGAAGNYTIGIATSNMSLGTYLASSSGGAGNLTAGVFLDKNISYDVLPDDPNIGQHLRVVLYGVSSGSTEKIAFDNVRLDYVPEPSALVLALAGLLGLIAYAWRKRG